MKKQNKFLSILLVISIILGQIFPLLTDIIYAEEYDKEMVEIDKEIEKDDKDEEKDINKKIIIKFELNYDTENKIESLELNKDDKINEETLVREDSKDGKYYYNFLGWSLAENEEENLWDFNKSIDENLEEEIDEITLYAQWEKIEREEYSIIFNPNGGNYSLDGEIIESMDRNILEGKRLSDISDINRINDLIFKERENELSEYKFTGWFYDKDGKRSVDFNKAVTESMTIYAGWDNYYIIEKDIIGGGKIDLNKSSAKPEDIIDVDIKPDEGHILELFQVKDNSGNLILEGSGNDKCRFKMPEDSVRIYAKFVESSQEEYTVRLNANGGYFLEDNEIYQITVQAGEKISDLDKIIENMDKDIDDKTFYHYVDNWYIDSECTEIYNRNKAVSRDMELFAKWEDVQEILVEFDPVLDEYEGEVIQKQLIVKKNGEFIEKVEDLFIEDSKYDEYNFLGWSVKEIDKLSNKTKPEDINIESDNDYWNFEDNKISDYLDFIDKDNRSLKLYAQWDITDLFESGNKDKPFIIEDEDMLRELAKRVNLGKEYKDCFYLIGKDMDLSEKEWEPIGNKDNIFKGNLSAGQIEKDFLDKAEDFIKSIFKNEDNLEEKSDSEKEYYRIKGLKINSFDDYIGLFGHVSGGEFKNLYIEGQIKGGNNVAGLIGFAGDNTKVENCIIDVKVSGKNKIAGIIGEGKDNINISNIENKGNIKGEENIAGLIGKSNNGLNITNSINKAAIKGSENIAGLLSETGSDLVLMKSVNEGDIESEGNAAGLVLLSDRNTIIFKSKNLGNITGNGYTAGILGKSNKEINTIKDTFNLGDITNTGNGKTAGIISELNGILNNGSIENVYNNGDIKGKGIIGGIIADSKKPIERKVRKIYNTGNLSGEGKITLGGIIGKMDKSSVLSDSYNLGNIEQIGNTEVTGIGGITGINEVRKGPTTEVPSSFVINSYNMGKFNVEAKEKIGGITGFTNENLNKNNYYLEDNSMEFSDSKYGKESKLEDFRNGEVSYLLDRGNSNLRNNIWSQDGEYPVFANLENRSVYKIDTEIIKGKDNGIIDSPKYLKSGDPLEIGLNLVDGYILESVAIKDDRNKNIDAVIEDNIIRCLMPESDIKIELSFIEIPESNTYNISFLDDNKEIQNQKINAGDRVIRPEDPKKDGFRFEGWYLDKELYNFNNIVVKDLELIAKWRETNKIKIEFDLNRPLDSQGSPNFDPIIINKGDSVDRPDDPVWNNSNRVSYYEFAGWYTGKNDGKEWDFNDEISEDMVLYARWISKDAFNMTDKDNPFIFKSAEELAVLAERVNTGNEYKNKYFELGNDIDLNDLEDLWRAIGYHKHISRPNAAGSTPANGSFEFDGNFNGKNNKITLQSEQIYPIFGCIGNDGIVKDINVYGKMSPDKSRQSFGGISAYNFGLIEDCHAELDQINREAISYQQTNGGIVGGNFGIINNCSAKVYMYGKYSDQIYLGGIAGLSKFGHTKNSKLLSGSRIYFEAGPGSFGDPMAFTGGIVGSMASAEGNEGSIINCETESDILIKGNGTQTGGITGQSCYIIKNCINRADIDLDGTAVGGISGYDGGSTELSNCINYGSIKGKAGDGWVSGLGGISGSNLKSISDSYSLGQVIAADGGKVAGISTNAKNIKNSYYYGDDLIGDNIAAISHEDSKDIENCYYGSESLELNDTNKGAILKSKEEFSNGQVAYLLDRFNDNKTWTLNGETSLPDFGSPHYGKVELEVLGSQGKDYGDITLVSNNLIANEDRAAYAAFDTVFGIRENLNTINISEDKRETFIIKELSVNGKDITGSKIFKISDSDNKLVVKLGKITEDIKYDNNNLIPEIPNITNIESNNDRDEDKKDIEDKDKKNEENIDTNRPGDGSDMGEGNGLESGNGMGSNNSGNGKENSKINSGNDLSNISKSNNSQDINNQLVLSKNMDNNSDIISESPVIADNNESDMEEDIDQDEEIEEEEEEEDDDEEIEESLEDNISLMDNLVKSVRENPSKLIIFASIFIGVNILIAFIRYKNRKNK